MIAARATGRLARMVVGSGVVVAFLFLAAASVAGASVDPSSAARVGATEAASSDSTSTAPGLLWLIVGLIVLAVGYVRSSRRADARQAPAADPVNGSTASSIAKDLPTAGGSG